MSKDTSGRSHADHFSAVTLPDGSTATPISGRGHYTTFRTSDGVTFSSRDPHPHHLQFQKDMVQDNERQTQGLLIHY